MERRHPRPDPHPRRAPGPPRSNITFTDDEIAHTGGTGIDLADGTQNSTVYGQLHSRHLRRRRLVGEVDDYYLTDTSRMTTGDTISQNWIDHPGQDY